MSRPKIPEPDCYEFFRRGSYSVLETELLDSFWDQRVEDGWSVKDHLAWLLAVAYRAGQDSRD